MEGGWEGGRVEGDGGQGVEGKEEKGGKGGRRVQGQMVVFLPSHRMEDVLVLEMWPRPLVSTKDTVSPSLLPSSHPLLLHPSPSPSPSLSGAGADYVMLGGMLAGHDQSGGDIIERDGKMYKLFYGMSSATAMQKYSGGVKDYR